MRFKIGLLLFPNLTQLDLTGPYEVFTKFPDTEVASVVEDPRSGHRRRRHAAVAHDRVRRQSATRPHLRAGVVRA